MPRKKKNVDLSRRRFLGASTAVAAAGIVGGLAAGGVGGYLTGQAAAPVKIEKVPGKPKINAAFVYVGPIGDFGWTFAHNRGRLFAEDRLKAAGVEIKTPYLESVPETTSGPSIDTLVSQGANIVFTTSFGFMNPTADVAGRHSDVIFEHCSGYKSGAAGNAPKNMGSYFADFYQIYYLNGLAGGAMNKTGHVGYVAAFLIPEVVRHINAFTLGVREAGRAKGNPDIKVHVVTLNSWIDEVGQGNATRSLIEENNADVISYTSDFPITLRIAEEYQTQRNKRVWSFSHYSDMQQFGPTAHLTGQVVEWGPIYLDLITQALNGTWDSRDIWTRAGDYDPFRWRSSTATPDPSAIGKVEGTVHPAVLNPVIPEEVRAETARLWADMKEMLFEPFTGPIRDRDGKLRLKQGERIDHDGLSLMNWFVEGVEGGQIPTT